MGRKSTVSNRSPNHFGMADSASSRTYDTAETAHREQRPTATLSPEIPASAPSVPRSRSKQFLGKNDWAKKYWSSFCP
jgi:hypothetical protein